LFRESERSKSNKEGSDVKIQINASVKKGEGKTVWIRVM